MAPLINEKQREFWKTTSLVRSKAHELQPLGDKPVRLNEDFKPQSWDVICSGGKESFSHIGNRRFRVCIDNNLATYESAATKHDRSAVVTVVVDAVRESCTQECGGFVRREPGSGRWFMVEEKIAREKVGHALRDAIKLRDRRQQRKSKTALRKRNRSAASSSGEEDAIQSSHKRSCTEDCVPLVVSNDTVSLRTSGNQNLSKASVDRNDPKQKSKANTSNRMVASEIESDSEDSVLVKMAKKTVPESHTTSSEQDADAVYENSKLQMMELMSPMKSTSTNSRKRRVLEWNPPGLSGVDAEFEKFMNGTLPASQGAFPDMLLDGLKKPAAASPTKELEFNFDEIAEDSIPSTAAIDGTKAAEFASSWNALAHLIPDDYCA